MLYDYQDFSKNDKKQLVRLYNLGVQREMDHFLKESLLQNQKAVLKNHEDIRPAYWELANSFKDFSKHLVRTYDNTTHRHYPNVICRLLNEEHFVEADLDGFSPEGLEKIKSTLASMRAMDGE